DSDGDFVPGQNGGEGGAGDGSDGDQGEPKAGGGIPRYRDEEDNDEDDDDEEEGSVPKQRTKSKKLLANGAKKKKKKSGSKGKRKRGVGASALFDDEAEESDDGGGRGRGGSEEDEEDDEDNDYQFDGFVVGDDEASEEEEPERRSPKSSSRRNKRKRLRKAKEGLDAMDDEDLELIREAQGVSVRQTREYDGNELMASDGRDLGNQLFAGQGDEAGMEPSRQRQGMNRRAQQDLDDFDSEDDGDFIVDDLGGDRRPVRRAQQQSFQAGPMDASQDQLDEALEIFGEGIQAFDLKEDGDEDLELGPDGKPLRSSRDIRKKFLESIEPSIRKEKFLTELDKTLQDVDRPERLQLRMPSRGEASEQELKDEAQWIYNQLDLGYHAHEETAKRAVEHVLRFLGVESQEIPFIWHYRRDYLWTGPSTYLTRENLWKIFDLDEIWGKVGARREKVAKASTTLWKLIDGGADSNDEDDKGYSSETADARDERLALEEAAVETRQNRLRRSELALSNAKIAVEKAEAELEAGFEAINKMRLVAAKAVKAAQVAAKKEAGEFEEEDAEVGEGDWQRATKESLEAALEEAKEAHTHASSYVIGLKGELAVEQQEEAVRSSAREERRQERKNAAAQLRQQKREAARAALDEEASLFPAQQYSFMLDSQEEVELKDLQEYFGLVSLLGDAAEKLRNATGRGGGGEAKEVTVPQKRRAKRAGRADDSLYRAARQAGLRGLANKFSMTAAQLGEVVQGLTMARYEVPTPSEPVDLVASDMAGASDTPLFDSSESILRGVRHILAREISAEPRVKAKCRQIYRRFAVLSTNPTDRGREEIDAFHPLYGLHYLKQKEVGEFFLGEDRTQWLRIEKGKAEGMLTWKIHPPERSSMTVDDRGNMVDSSDIDLSPFLSLLNPTYNPGGGGGFDSLGGASVKQGWEEQRRLVVKEALVSHILPGLEMEVVSELRSAARTAIIQQASDALERRLAFGPYERQELSSFEKIIKADSVLKHDQMRVVGIFVSAESRDDSWAVAIDPSGSVLDHLQMPFQRDMRAKKLKVFLKATRPHVVAVSTSAGQGSRMIMDMLVNRMSGQNGQPRTGLLADAHREFENQRQRDRYDDDYLDEEDSEKDLWKHCAMLPVKDDVASIFARSPRGEKEFPDFAINQRAAVAVGRYLQDPLVEFAGMWTTMDSSGNFGYEMFSLKLHPLQDLVPPQQLLRVWAHRLMDGVSDVGVDINHIVEHDHALGILQFVPGLGPRKAAKLREKLGTVMGGVVPSRKSLLSTQVLKSLVYTNAAGFLRIRKRGKLAERMDTQLDPFDDTRVHPECYNTQDWAQRVCANALDVQVDEDYFPIVESAMEDSREALQRYCQHNEVDSRMPPVNLNDSVNQLDLSAYADELERQGEGKRALQLDSIVEEIRYPYRDRRHPYAAPDENEMFQWLTGETDATLREGVLVPVRVTQVREKGVRVRIEGGVGLFAFVPADHVTDDVLGTDPITGQANLRQAVKENQVMEAAIIKVDKSRFELKLSLRKSDTLPNPDKWDEPVGGSRAFGASGWNRPLTLPRLDAKFDAGRAKQEARERIRDANRKASERAYRGGGGGGSADAGRSHAGVRFPRSIMHPNFRNVTHVEAEKILSETCDARGEALIRPSSKGADRLSLTWMWVDGEFLHADIQEVGKQPGSALAPCLKIKGEEYEDLDEIMSRRVSACNDLVNEVLSSDKYNPGTLEETETALRAKKMQEPTYIPYALCRMRAPGYMALLYLPVNS
ncbi:unnamed protein product, partial [Ascophyllum nodosum]